MHITWNHAWCKYAWSTYPFYSHGSVPWPWYMQVIHAYRYLATNSGTKAKHGLKNKAILGVGREKETKCWFSFTESVDRVTCGIKSDQSRLFSINLLWRKNNTNYWGVVKKTGLITVRLTVRVYPPPLTVRVSWFFQNKLTYFDLFYHFIMGKIGPKFSHLLMVRAAPPPP